MQGEQQLQVRKTMAPIHEEQQQHDENNNYKQEE
jgi:hypothetical protein